MTKLIPCPWCSPHDVGTIDDDPEASWYYICTHCGNYLDKETFLVMIREQIVVLTIRIQEFIDLVRTP